MTTERKAEVNRRLFVFEGRGLGYSETDSVDYTADLNAIAQLEAKLPLHTWANVLRAPDQLWEMWGEDDAFMGGGQGPTEAEARAEAICQYLESKGEGR